MVIALCISLLALSAPGDEAYHAPTAEERALLDRYLSAVESLDRKLDHVSGLASFVETYSREVLEWKKKAGQPIDLRREFRFFRDGYKALLAMKKPDGSIWRILCRNRDYSFHLERNPDGSPLPFSVRGLDTNPKIDTGIRYLCLTFVDSMRGTFYGKATDIFRDESLRIGSISRVRLGARECFRIEYQHELRGDNKLYRSGWIIVSPDEGWVTREFLCRPMKEATGSSPLHGVITYTESTVDRTAIPVKIALDEGPITRALKVSEVVYGLNDTGIYTVSRYGLPEQITSPAGAAAKGHPVLWALASASCVVSAVLLRRVGRRIAPVAVSASGADAP